MHTETYIYPGKLADAAISDALRERFAETWAWRRVGSDGIEVLIRGRGTVVVPLSDAIGEKIVPYVLAHLPALE